MPLQTGSSMTPTQTARMIIGLCEPQMDRGELQRQIAASIMTIQSEQIRKDANIVGLLIVEIKKALDDLGMDKHHSLARLIFGSIKNEIERIIEIILSQTGSSPVEDKGEDDEAKTSDI